MNATTQKKTKMITYLITNTCLIHIQDNIWWIWRVSILTSLLSYCHHSQGSVKVLDDLNFQKSHQQISSTDFCKLWQFQNKIFSLFSLEFTKSHYKAGFHMSGMQKKSISYNFLKANLWYYISHKVQPPSVYLTILFQQARYCMLLNVKSPFFS